jgi:DNA polymerase elongation subunit (family B)
MGDIIYHLFTNRLKHKKAGNQAMQLILKLMMNSAYGKTITKKTMIKKVIIHNDKKEQYISNYFNTIKEFKQLTNKQWEVKMDCVDSSYNMAQIGSFVLSYSKRIMNEVFNIANTYNCPLYYTDTDSIHCNYDDVKTIENEFRNTYNRELTGKQLGQFHIDFDLHGAKSEIYSTKSIFLGKKCYIDCLESTDKKGNTIKGYHYRMKGVNSQGIQHCADTYFKGNIYKVYKHLSKGNEQEFVLNPEGGRPSFEYVDAGVRTRETGTFTRTVQF